MRDVVREIIGIDIAETMVDFAEDKDVYEGLYVGEIIGFLEDNDEDPFDLVIAADVLPYLGDGRTAVRRRCRRPASERRLRLFDRDAGDRTAPMPSGRTGGSCMPRPICATGLTAAGFEVLAMDEINVRDEDEAPSPGHLVVAQKS